jgi:hypothetical protein
LVAISSNILYIIKIFSMLTTPYPSFPTHNPDEGGALTEFFIEKELKLPSFVRACGAERRGRGWLRETQIADFSSPF